MGTPKQTPQQPPTDGDDGHHAGEQQIAADAIQSKKNKSQLSTFQGNVMLGTPPDRPDNPSLGALQRRIFIPSAHTCLSMGQMDTRNGQYNGFGVHTEGHALVSAMGPDPEGSRLVFESQGNMVVQSVEGSLFMGAKGMMALCAGENMLIGGAGGVLIHGGKHTSITNPLPDARSGTVPHAAHSMHEIEAAYHHIKQAWEGFDAAVCALEMRRYAHKKKVDSWKKRAKLLLTAPGAIHAIGFVAGAVGATAGYTGTVIHGDSGVLVASPGFTSLYGGPALTLGSGGGIFLGALGRFECYAITNAEILSWRNISVDSGGTIEIISKSDLELCSRKDQLHLDGKKVSIGGKGSPGSQHETKSVAGYATDLVATQGASLAAKGSKTAGITSPKIHIGGTKFSNLSSDKIAVWCVGKSQIVVQKDKVMLGMFNSKAGDPPTLDDYPTGKDASGAGGCVKGRGDKLGKYASSYSEPTEGGSFVKMTDSDILIQCKGHKIKGDSSGWTFPKMKVLK